MDGKAFRRREIIIRIERLVLRFWFKNLGRSKARAVEKEVSRAAHKT
jgi:hypothetical protein